MKKYFKSGLLILLTTSILLGGVGCMNQSENNKGIIQEKMYNYACEKYTQKFEIVDFEYALRGLDAYRNDVLTLSDGNNFVFNVTHAPEDNDCVKLYDDYYVEVLEQKFSDYLIEQNNVSLNLNTVVMLDEDYTNDEIESLTVPQLVTNKGLIKLIVIVVAESDDDYIHQNLTDIYNLYKNVCELTPKYLDFQFVVSNSMTDKLAGCVNNPRKNYENDWNLYDNIVEYLNVNELLLDMNVFEEKIIKV